MRARAELETGQQAQHRLLDLAERDTFLQLSCAKLRMVGERQPRQVVRGDPKGARFRGRSRNGELVVGSRRETDQPGELDPGEPALAALALERIHRREQLPLVAQRSDRFAHVLGREPGAVFERGPHPRQQGFESAECALCRDRPPPCAAHLRDRRMYRPAPAFVCDQRPVGLLLRPVVGHPEIQHIPDRTEIAGISGSVGRGRCGQRFPPSGDRAAGRSLHIAAGLDAVAPGERRQQPETGQLDLAQGQVPLHRLHVRVGIVQQRAGHRAMQGERPVEQRLPDLKSRKIGLDPLRRVGRCQRLGPYRAAREQGERGKRLHSGTQHSAHCAIPASIGASIDASAAAFPAAGLHTGLMAFHGHSSFSDREK